MYKHIMLPVDGSALSVKAVDECLAFAKSAGAKVTFLTVVPRSSMDIPGGWKALELVQDIEKAREAEYIRQANKWSRNWKRARKQTALLAIVLS